MTDKKPHNDSETLAYVLDIINEGIWDWDSQTGIVNRSPGWFSMLGYQHNALNPTVFTWENIIHPEDYPQVMAIFDNYVEGNSKIYEAEYRCKKSDGNYLWIHDHGKIVKRNADGSIARMIGAHTNIHEYKLAQAALTRQNKMLLEDNFNLENVVQQRTAELEKINHWLENEIKKSKHDANTDILTSLFNRRKFEVELNKEISRSKRYLSPMSLLLLDADYFKNINDQYGHEMGDKALISLANTIILHLREPDVAARWGGEEFVVILPETTLDQALIIAEKKRSAIEQSLIEDKFNLTCSIGVTEFKVSDSFDSLIKRLDDALYDAKAAGRNCVMFRN